SRRPLRTISSLSAIQRLLLEIARPPRLRDNHVARDTAITDAASKSICCLLCFDGLEGNPESVATAFSTCRRRSGSPEWVTRPATTAARKSCEAAFPRAPDHGNRATGIRSAANTCSERSRYAGSATTSRTRY